ncbi:MAG TPA: hypothetical protein VHM28_10665 [Anaerolineales bacterium]|jgi:hypothetical protein|nr:hypothetical protein [Anaerolineales bacterium]
MDADKLADWKERIAKLDAALKPIANRPVDITDPNWVAKLRSLPKPLDEAGVRTETESLLAEVIEFYPSSDDETRPAIRKLFAEHRSFLWAAALSYRPITDESFRAYLILFSIKDGGIDTRDAILLLQSLCAEAASAGVKIRPILQEIAELSSDVNKYGMGSTKSLLLREYER